MGRRAVLPHYLAEPALLQLPDEPWPHKQCNQKSCHGSIDSPERDVAEDIEKCHHLMQRIQQMIEHCRLPLFLWCACRRFLLQKIENAFHFHFARALKQQYIVRGNRFFELDGK